MKSPPGFLAGQLIAEVTGAVVSDGFIHSCLAKAASLAADVVQPIPHPDHCGARGRVRRDHAAVRPLKTQRKISGRLTSDDVTQDRLDIRSYIDTTASTAKTPWMS